MITLLLFLVLFGLVHLVPVVPSLKARGQSLLGKAYGPVYGIASLLLLVGSVWAVRVAERAPLYDVPSWGAHANFGLSLLGFLCLGIFLCRGSWRNHLRYPMAIGILLWSLGHLLANGDTATSLFFGGFAVIAILNAALKMSGGPFVPSDVRGGHNLLSIFVGLALYALMTQFHMALIGVPLVKLS